MLSKPAPGMSLSRFTSRIAPGFLLPGLEWEMD